MFTAYSDNIEQLIGLIAGLAGSTSNAGLLHDAVALLNLQCRRNLPDASVASSMAYWGVAVLTSQPCCRLPACRHGNKPAPASCAGGNRPDRQASQQADQSAEAAAVQAMRQQMMSAPLGQPLGVAPALWFKTASAQMANLKKLQDALLQQLDDNMQQLLSQASSSVVHPAGFRCHHPAVVGTGLGHLPQCGTAISRLEQLMSGMSRDFDLSRRAALPGSDEIARMGNAFDHLADAFADTLRQIKSEAHQMMAAAIP
jgi:methyl-accepting chemotaxis protein